MCYGIDGLWYGYCFWGIIFLINIYVFMYILVCVSVCGRLCYVVSGYTHACFFYMFFFLS